MQKQHKFTSMFALIIAGEAIFLLPFILMRVFKPVIREAFLISDAQIGEAQALYGITAVISYFFGGFIADKWEARKLLSISLILTAIGGFWMTMIPSIFTLKILYAFWGVSTILLFWASLIKATRQWGNSHNQGLSFGLLDGGRGFFAATIALFGAAILTYFFPAEAVNITIDHKVQTLQYIIGTITAIVFLVSLFVWFVLPKENVIKSSSKEFQFDFKQAFQLMKKRKVIYHSLIIFCAYCAYKLTGTYGTYAKDVWNYSLEEATYFAVFIQYLRPIAAITVGWIADKFVPSKLIIPCFTILIIASAILGMGFFHDQLIYLSFTFFIFMALGTYALRGLYFAIIEETKTPLQLTGTLVGIISVVGFTPDIFMSLFIGYMLGKGPTIVEYQNLYSLFTIIPIIGLLAAIGFRKAIK
ncbi:Inner membrane protein YqcE [Polaribacter huanghezhanensis]|uniref:MFS transporter n=1 Tax=Polaribacter huanghezhanensis TaxID=1354726 RepID=UPI00264949BF|nr:MFS transporter [Polaribacter huanghezhanensis]WKD86946.1 Inner membrane protein YqcE [Polaribacter huanghezhanensis]